MKKLLIALALVSVAPAALAQGASSPQGSTTASSINRMEVTSESTILGSGNTKLSTQYNVQEAEGFAAGYGREAIAQADASNLLIDRQVDVIDGDHNTVAADDYNEQFAFAEAESFSWGTPAAALTVNELGDSDDRFVQGFGNIDMRDKENEQEGYSFAFGERAVDHWPKRTVCTSGGLCVR